MRNDPGEERDVSADHPDEFRMLGVALDAWTAGIEYEPARIERSEEQLERLRALGYL